MRELHWRDGVASYTRLNGDIVKGAVVRDHYEVSVNNVVVARCDPKHVVTVMKLLEKPFKKCRESYSKRIALPHGQRLIIRKLRNSNEAQLIVRTNEGMAVTRQAVSKENCLTIAAMIVHRHFDREANQIGTELSDTMIYLYERYRDEHAYESIDDYADHINFENRGIVDAEKIRMTGRPFALHFRILDFMEYEIRVTRTELKVMCR